MWLFLLLFISSVLRLHSKGVQCGIKKQNQVVEDNETQLGCSLAWSTVQLEAMGEERARMPIAAHVSSNRIPVQSQPKPQQDILTCAYFDLMYILVYHQKLCHIILNNINIIRVTFSFCFFIFLMYFPLLFLCFVLENLFLEFNLQNLFGALYF